MGGGGGGGRGRAAHKRERERAEGGRKRGHTKALQVRSEELWGDGGGFEEGLEEVRVS